MNTFTRDEISRCQFFPSKEGVELESRLLDYLEGHKRYEPIRLMLGRSLMDHTPPKPLEDKKRLSKKTIRGRDLFGNELDLWISIFLLDGNFTPPVQLHDFRNAVEAHWHRGCILLIQDLNKSNHDIVKFAHNLANLLPQGESFDDSTPSPSTSSGQIQLQVGRVSESYPEGNKIKFTLNGIGSPHIVLLGKTGMGKTRIGVEIIQQLLKLSKVPFIYIDPKPDFAPNCQYYKCFDDFAQSTTLIIGKEPVPLDFLPQLKFDNIKRKAACMRLRDSICSSTPTATSSIQKDRLLKCIISVAEQDKDRNIGYIKTMYDNALKKDNSKSDTISSVLSELNQFHTFTPEMQPKEFFSKSWILSISSEIPNSYRSLIMQLLLDAESAYWKSEPDAPLHDKYRQLKHLLVIDEAYRILKKKRNESLVEMITQFRSRGCVLMLISQNPGDFASDDYEYMTQIGTVISFACSQTERGLAPLRGIFGRKLLPKEFSENQLTNGLSFCKLPSHEPLVIKAFD